MILHAAFLGSSHFEEFHTELGIARNILSNRLARLAKHGILTRGELPGNHRKIQYSLTAKGDALLPTMVAMRQWGEEWGTGIPARPIIVDARDMRPIQLVRVRSHDDRALSATDLRWN